MSNQIEKYQELLREHGEDVLAVTKQDFFSEETLNYYYKNPNNCGNVENKFCMCLTAVMLLKKMGIFDRNHKIRKINNIGGGFYNDGDNFGLVFRYNSRTYVLTSRPQSSDEDVVYIPLDENSEEVIKTINEACQNRYLIDFNINKNNNSTIRKK